MRAILVGILLVFFGLFLVLPLFVVFHEAFAQGVRVFLKNVRRPRDGSCCEADTRDGGDCCAIERDISGFLPLGR